MTTSKSLLMASILAGVSTLVTTHASAAYCHAYVTQVAVDGTGIVRVTTTPNTSWPNASERIALSGNHMCDLDTTVGSITPQVCEKMYSTFASAYLSGRPVIVWFAGGSCPALASGAAAYGGGNPYNSIELR